MIDRMGQYPGPYGPLDLMPTPAWLRPLDRWRKTRIAAAQYAPELDRLIKERRDPNYAGRRDLLWRLANARDRDTGEGLSRDELHDEMLTLGATSATSLRPLPWIWYLLATHPWAERRLHAELDRVLGSGPVNVRDLARLTWLRQVLDETMRLYPPLPIMMMRRAVAADTLCGRRIPRRSVVVIIPWVLHRHRNLWPDPDRFDPERFAPEAAASRSRYAYLPFAAGPHVCVGASMAMLQLTVAVAVLARHFRFRLVPDRPVEPTAWTNLRPKRGMWMTQSRAASSRAARPELLRAPQVATEAQAGCPLPALSPQDARRGGEPMAMPPRPARPLSSLALLRTFTTNSLAACDDELFEELFVERRYFWGRVFVVSDPDGMRRVLQDNTDNYQRIAAFRRIFEFSSGGGMVCLEGEDWWRHRRIVNPALDQRALRPDLGALIALTEEMAGFSPRRRAANHSNSDARCST